MKKIFSIVLVLVVLLFLISCDNRTDKPESSTETTTISDSKETDASEKPSDDVSKEELPGKQTKKEGTSPPAIQGGSKNRNDSMEYINLS